MIIFRMRPIDPTIDLRFYFITDDAAPALSARDQAEIAILAGATIVQYRNKNFSEQDFTEAAAVRKLCALYNVPFIVNDDIVLARALAADGVHLGQKDADPATARRILGNTAIIGISVSTPEELGQTDLGPCDYVGSGPVCFTGTKTDANPVIGYDGLASIAAKVPLPVVAIGGITPDHIDSCFKHGAAGVAVISAITRAEDSHAAAAAFAKACGCHSREHRSAWHDEFNLIRRIIAESPSARELSDAVEILPGDDAALYKTLQRPVITTDTQREGIHFRRQWQSMAEIGYKAVVITLSDLAASYARPVSLFVNLAIPEAVAEEDILDLYRGIEGALTAHQTVLGGGNISGAAFLGLDLFAMGEGHPDIFPVRSGAEPGFGLYVTGPLGKARAGLDCLIRREHEFPELVKAFKAPQARFDAAKVLADHGVSCVMDLSDGLAGDAAHIARASGVTIRLDPTSLPIDPVLAQYCQKYELAADHTAVAGGEDYELLFACPPGLFDQIREDLPGAYQVGICALNTGNLLEGLPDGIRGYQHGRPA